MEKNKTIWNVSQKSACVSYSYFECTSYVLRACFAGKQCMVTAVRLSQLLRLASSWQALEKHMVNYDISDIDLFFVDEAYSQFYFALDCWYFGFYV